MRKAILEGLALRTLCFNAPPTLKEMASMMRLRYRVVDEPFRRLRAEHLLELPGMAGTNPRSRLHLQVGCVLLSCSLLTVRSVLLLFPSIATFTRHAGRVYAL